MKVGARPVEVGVVDVAVLNAPDATSRRNDGFPPSGHLRTNGEELCEDVVVGREGGSALEGYSSGRVGMLLQWMLKLFTLRASRRGQHQCPR